MPTKREILEDRTIEELRQMAREKDLSGYSNLEKPELIDLLEVNYSKKEITEWPSLGIQEVGSGEEADEEEHTEEHTITKVPEEDFEIDKKVPKDSDMVFVSAILGVIVAGSVAIILLILSYI